MYSHSLFGYRSLSISLRMSSSFSSDLARVNSSGLVNSKALASSNELNLSWKDFFVSYEMHDDNKNTNKTKIK